MDPAEERRTKLLDFIDKKAFDVILRTSAEKYTGKDRESFEFVRKKTENEKKKFHEVYKTAQDVRKNFLQNVHSRPALKLDGDLEHLGLIAAAER